MEDINFTDGMYSYDDLNDYIQEILECNGDDKEGIKLSSILSTYKVVIELKSRWQLDTRNSNFGDLSGFDHKLLQKTETSVKLPNITNSVDAVIIGCDIVSDSLVDGRRSDTLAVITTDNLTRSYPFTFEP